MITLWLTKSFNKYLKLGYMADMLEKVGRNMRFVLETACILHVYGYMCVTCLYAHICLYVCLQVYVCMLLRRPEVDVTVFPNCSSFDLFRQSLSLNMELTNCS